MDTRLLTYRNLIKFFKDGDTKTLVNEYNDLFCLFLSQMVYFSHSFIEKHLIEIGCDRVSIIDYNGPTTVCIDFAGVTYVAVKGLSGRNKEEWPIILNFFAKEFEGTEAHGGFVITSGRLLPHVKAFVADKDNPVVLTGHSMGGAIATLVSLAVAGCKVVTFGSPKIVERDALEVFEEKDLMHYLIDTDFVTHLPPFIYKRPGKALIKRRPLNPFRFWDNHKLYNYSKFLIPVLSDPDVASSLHHG